MYEVLGRGANIAIKRFAFFFFLLVFFTSFFFQYFQAIRNAKRRNHVTKEKEKTRSLCYFFLLVFLDARTQSVKLRQKKKKERKKKKYKKAPNFVLYWIFVCNNTSRTRVNIYLYNQYVKYLGVKKKPKLYDIIFIMSQRRNSNSHY